MGLFLAALAVDVFVVVLLGIAMAAFVTALCKTIDWLFDRRHLAAERRAMRHRALLDVAMTKSIANRLGTGRYIDDAPRPASERLRAPR